MFYYATNFCWEGHAANYQHMSELYIFYKYAAKYHIIG